jgi:cell division protein FtsW
MPKKKKKRNKRVSSFVNNQFDFTLCITVLVLLAMGIIMVLSASAPSSLSSTGSSYTYVGKQLVFAVIGIVVMFTMSKIDYRFLKKYYWIIYHVSWIILLLVLVPGLGHSVNGATRWVDFKIIQFQPSEITKVGLIVFYAGYLSDHKSELTDLKKGFLKPLAYVLLPIGILFIVQNHMSVSLIIGIVTITMMVMAGCRMSHFVNIGALGASGLVGMFGLLQMSGKGGFRSERISTFFDPWSDSLGTGYQMVQSLYAIGSGGFFGVGLGNSKQKYLYIPEPHNDFIFAILAEELGFIGCVVVIALFALFTWRGIVIAMKSQDTFGSLLAVGITTLITAQAVINIAVVTASMPTTGMSLPFFSYGGTALLILLFDVGILLNISRSCSKV